MRDRESAAVAVLLLATFVAASVTALAYPPDARRLPLLVSVLGAVLCAIALWGALRPAKTETPPPERAPIEGELAMLGWFTGFVAAAIALGVVPGGALALVAFLRIRGRESWGSAALWSLGSAGAVHLFFEQLLGASFFPGLLLAWIAGVA
jgi:hypothetical protein